MEIPRNDYPRPQMVREGWYNLNGVWEFEIDYAMVGKEKDFQNRAHLNEKILVPFCPESRLSGIEHKDFMSCVWYHTTFRDIRTRQGRLLLHFGAVDYRAEVYLNGRMIGTHEGGYTPFSFDITDDLKETNELFVSAYDDALSDRQPHGKQSKRLNSYGCLYTRTTGIWQTVWLEEVDACHVESIRTTTEIDGPTVSFELRLTAFEDAEVSAAITYEGTPVGKATAHAYSDTVHLTAPLSEAHLWEAGCGRLYDVRFTVSKNGALCDEVTSYFGLRSVGISGKKFLLNGKPLFGRWVLDQGFYPDGIYTAPDEEALKADIVNAMKLGFNGARLHEKIFEPRYLYWADRLGYLCWGEYPNWGLDITDMASIRHVLPEWIKALQRDFSHPSIIGWCPFNETWDFQGRKQCDEVIRMTYEVTKAIDKTRPVIDTSGNFHVVTDIFDVHDYDQNPEKMKENYKDGQANDQVRRDIRWQKRQEYDGKLPLFISEYGGTRWALSEDGGWGYGKAAENEQAFIDRYRGLTEAILQNENIMGFCYTQLYDVEQEKNGLMTYSRAFKLDPKIIYDINTQKAAIER